MPAVVRIKRRIDEEPHTALVLNSKRPRLQADHDEVLMKFAGTLQNQDDSATKKFAAARLNKARAKELVQNKDSHGCSGESLAGIRRSKLRNQAQQAAHEQRFRVVNCLRTTLDANEAENGNATRSSEEAQLPESSNSKQITIVDIETQHTDGQTPQTTQSQQDAHLQLSGETQPADSDIGYVYDLYVPENEQHAATMIDMMDDNYLSIRPVGEIMFEDTYRDDEDANDSEDSNQENYYTNDYPDEDDVYYDDEIPDKDADDLCHKMHNFMFDNNDDDESDSSSEDEDYNKFEDPYSLKADSKDFVDDVDFCNAGNLSHDGGSAYKRFWRRLKREQKKTKSSDDDLSST